MKKFLSVILCALLVLSCSVSAAPARKTEPRPADKALFAAEGLEMVPAELTLPMFSSSSGERLRVRNGGELAAGTQFNWSSSDTGVVRVSSSGGLTAVAPGAAVVTASNAQGAVSCAVTVVADEDFPRLADVEAEELALPFYSETVGIGPLGGAQPMFLKRFINPPSCGDTPEPDPNDLIASEGWTYTYAAVYKFNAENGHSYRFETAASSADGMHAANAYICIYDQFFNLWEYSRGSGANPFGSVNMDSYEDSVFYVVISPISHTDDAGSGFIRLYVYDTDRPYAMGDVDLDHSVTAIDALLTLRFTLDLAELDADAFLLADMTGDGEVEGDDVLMILRTALGLS